ncbi:MAG: TonB-dependent receptor, partial [Flavitalea sp.]
MKSFILLAAFLFPIFVSAQVTGRVVSGNNPIPYASILVKNTRIATTSDSLGRFEINGIEKFPVTLVVSFTGFEPEEKIIRDASGDVVIRLQAVFQNDTIVITSRRRKELLQDVPIPVSVVSGAQIDIAGAFNINRVKELIPSVQLYSSNPRNTGLNIRGLGSSFGLTNDGLDPGVGLYIDGVYFARPAATTLDFIDIEQIEVLRGPQGTLFGKNTTSGAINITTRKPAFKPGGSFEVSYGNYGFIQAKASITGPLSRKIAGRLSLSGTQRDGTIYNERTLKHINDINNLGVKAQLLYKASKNTNVTLSGDFSLQRPNGYAQVVAGVVETKRAPYRQFNAIISDLNYQLPSLNAFDRVVDHDSPWNSGNDLGGGSATIETKIGE